MRGDTKFFILKGPDHEMVEVPFETWAEWFAEHKQLALDEGDNWGVSSIFLGIDHSYDQSGFFFETLADYPDGERDINRFRTYEHCLEFHAMQVAVCKQKAAQS